MRSRPLAGSAFGIEDRQGIVSDIRPTKPDKLLDALATGEQVQSQRRCLTAGQIADQFPVLAQLCLGEWPLVCTVELCRASGLRGRVEYDTERLEHNGNGRSGPDVQSALIRCTEIRPQLVRGAP